MSQSTNDGSSGTHTSRLKSLVRWFEDEVDKLRPALTTQKSKGGRRSNIEKASNAKEARNDASPSPEQRRVDGSSQAVQEAVEAIKAELRKQYATVEAEKKTFQTELAEAKSRSSALEKEVRSLETQLSAARGSAAGAQEGHRGGDNAAITALESALFESNSYSKQLESQLAGLESRLQAARRQRRAEAEGPAATGTAPAGQELPFGVNDPTFAQAQVRLPADVAEPFYHQTMAPLTVMLACADILLMSNRLDADLKDTVGELKTQTQTLLNLIKGYTLPPDIKNS